MGLTAVAAVGAAGSMMSASQQSDAASSAASAQTQAANNATQAQMSMFNTTQANLSPYMGMGQQSLSALANEFGIGGYSPYQSPTNQGGYNGAYNASNTSATAAQPIPQSPQNLTANYGNLLANSKTNGMIAPNRGSLLFGNPAGNFTNLPANAIALSANGWPGYTSVPGTGAVIPSAQVANSAVPPTQNANAYNMTGAASSDPWASMFSQPFNAADLSLELSPAYQFQLAQGQKALQNSQAAGNGALSGAALKGMQDYTQGMASTAYQNAFNNWSDQAKMRYNQLSNLAGLGQNAAAGVGNMGVQTGQSIGQNMIGAGNAQAASAIAQGNANSNAINNATGYYQLGQMTGGGGGLGSGGSSFGDMLWNGSF